MKKITLTIFTLILLFNLKSQAFAQRGIATPTPTVASRSVPTSTPASQRGEPIPTRESTTQSSIPTPTTVQANRIILTPTVIPSPTRSIAPSLERVIKIRTIEQDSQKRTGKIETLIEESETINTEDKLKIFFKKLPKSHKSSNIPTISTDDKKVKLNFNEKAKLFGIFDVNLTREVEADITSGQIKVKQPWWSFLTGNKSTLKNLEKIKPESFLRNIRSDSPMSKKAMAGLVLSELSDEEGKREKKDRYFFVEESEVIRFEPIEITPVEDNPIGD